MQRLGKSDMVMMTFVGGEPPMTLHRTPSGFQFGLGKDAQIVTHIDEVKGFHPSVQVQVQAWLNQGGVKKANQARTEQEISDRASEGPGTLDAMAEKLGPGVKAQIYEMLKSFVQGGGVTQVSPPAGILSSDREKVPGGMMVNKPGGMTEFVPDDNIGDLDDKEVDQVVEDTIEKIESKPWAGMTEDEEEMAGVASNGGEMMEEISESRAANRRPRAGRPRK